MCSKGKPHTPIVSRKQQRLFAVIAKGKSTKATGLSKTEAERHLAESKGKSLPFSSPKRRKK